MSRQLEIESEIEAGRQIRIVRYLTRSNLTHTIQVYGYFVRLTTPTDSHTFIYYLIISGRSGVLVFVVIVV